MSSQTNSTVLPIVVAVQKVTAPTVALGARPTAKTLATSAAMLSRARGLNEDGFWGDKLRSLGGRSLRTRAYTIRDSTNTELAKHPHWGARLL